MKIAPKKWTHHHTQRLYHISRLATFVLIIILIITGFFAGWFRVSADEFVYPSQSVSVSAVIPGVEEEPVTTSTPPSITTGGGGGLYVPIAVPGSAVNIPRSNIRVPLHITALINPNQSYKKLISQGSGKPLELQIVTVNQPTLTGTVTIPGAFIYFELSGDVQIVHMGVYADSRGHWQLTVPLVLSKGFYTARITGQDPVVPSNTEQKTMVWYVVGSKTGKVPIAVPGNFPQGTSSSWVMTVVNPGNKKIAPGSTIKFETLLHNGDHLPQPFKVLFTLVNSQGEKVFQMEDMVTVQDTVTFEKQWKILPSLAPGIYSVEVQVIQDKLLLISQDNFELQSPFVVATVNSVSVDRSLIYEILALLVFLMLIIWYESNKIIVVTKIIKQKSLA